MRYDVGETAGRALELLLARTELTPLELTVVGELAGSVEGRSTYPRLRSNADVRRSLGRLAVEFVAQQLVGSPTATATARTCAPPAARSTTVRCRSPRSS